MKKPRNTTTTPAIAMLAADPRLTAQQLHRHRGAGLAVIADAAPPRLVASDVLVLGLERLVATPRIACPLVPDDDEDDPGAPQEEVDDAHRQAPLVGVQASPDGGLDEGRVGLSARGLHHLADEEPDGLRLAGVIVGDGR